MPSLVGTHERSKDFVEVTGFPADRLLADPDSATYAALGLVKGVRQTFFSQEVSWCDGLPECLCLFWAVHPMNLILAP